LRMGGWGGGGGFFLGLVGTSGVWVGVGVCWFGGNVWKGL